MNITQQVNMNMENVLMNNQSLIMLNSTWKHICEMLENAFRLQSRRMTQWRFRTKWWMIALSTRMMDHRFTFVCPAFVVGQCASVAIRSMGLTIAISLEEAHSWDRNNLRRLDLEVTTRDGFNLDHCLLWVRYGFETRWWADRNICIRSFYLLLLGP